MGQSVSKKKTVAPAGSGSTGINSATQTALNTKLAIASNLSDVANPITSRNNLLMWDMFLTGGNQPTSSNVAASITDLVTPTLTINKRYKIKGQIHVGCNNTGGVKIQLTLPAGATMYVKLFGATTSVTAYQFSPLATSATLGLAFCQVNNANYFVDVDGEINMSTTAGVVQFGFASGTDTQTSTIYQLGTHLTLTQIN